MDRALGGALASGVILAGVAGCGDSCGTADLLGRGELVVGEDGPACDPCSAEAPLLVRVSLSAECGTVEWRTVNSCLLQGVRATRTSDGEVFSKSRGGCLDAPRDWSVAPGDDLVLGTFLFEVLGGPPFPAGSYDFEVSFVESVDIETVTFTATIESP